MRPVALAAFLLLVSASTAFAYVTPGPLFRANGYAFSAGATDCAAFADLNRDGLDDLVLGDWHGYAVALATGAGSFGPFEHRLTHLNSAFLVVADFDGDGLLDVGGTSAEAVFVQYGDGNGGVAASFELPIVDGPERSFAGDLDGDGRADLVTTDYSTPSFSVYLANGDRTLGAGTTFPLRGSPRIAIGNVIGSQAADIVVGYGELSEVDILPGVGDGTFGPAIVLPTPSSVDGVALGTMDAGTSLDLMLRSSPAEGVLFGSNQGGSFAPFESLPSPDGGFDVLVGDYDGDGKLDALSDVFFSGRSHLQAWLGDGAGGFGPRIDSGDVLYKIFGKAQGDVDGDGDLDVAGFNPTFYELILMPGNGDGTFGNCPPSPATVTGRLRGSAAGDFDGDGKIDAVGSNELTTKLAFARGRGDGTFDPIVESAVLPAGFLFLAAGNFDADPALDLVGVGGTLSFFHGNGNGTFAAPADFALGAGAAVEPRILDLDGNGKLDVVVPCTGANALYQFLQGPSGLAAPIISPTPSGPVDVRYADLNADGRLDRVVSCTNLVVSQLDNGIGGYTTVMSHTLAQPAKSLELGDLDEDGKLDLVYNEYLANFQAMSRSPILHVLKGQGAGVFDTETIVSADFDPGAYSLMSHRSLNRIYCLDLDEDGHLDLVGPDQGLFQFDALRGNGDRTFKLAESYLGPFLRHSASFGDFNGDGHVDILTTGDKGGQTSFTVFLNRTGGVVGVPPSPTPPTASIALATPFPNPARSSFTLRFRVLSRETVTVDVVSVAGRRVLSRRMEPAGVGEQSLRLDGLDGLSAGVYAVVVSQGERRASTRVVVMP